MILLDKHTKLIAVSGGPDSMYLLSKLRKKYKNLVVCHLNYGSAPTCLEMEKIVITYCKKFNLKLENIRVTKKMMSKNKVFKNFHAQGRIVRYKFFQEIAKKYNTKTIFMAHHKDDFIESCLIKEKKNSESLFFGFKKKTFLYDLEIIRPLLKEWKDNIEKKCIKKAIPYVHDKTNFDIKYLRNEIRQNLKVISKKDKNIIYKHFLKLNRLNEKMFNLVKISYKKWKENKYDINYFINLNKEDLKKYLIYEFLINHSTDDISINKSKILEIIKFIEARSKKEYRVMQNIYIKISKENSLLLRKWNVKM